MYLYIALAFNHHRLSTTKGEAFLGSSAPKLLTDIIHRAEPDHSDRLVCFESQRQDKHALGGGAGRAASKFEGWQLGMTGMDEMNQVEGLGCLHSNSIARSGLAMLEVALLSAATLEMGKWESGEVGKRGSLCSFCMNRGYLSVGLLPQCLSRSSVHTKVAQLVKFNSELVPKMAVRPQPCLKRLPLKCIKCIK